MSDDVVQPTLLSALQKLMTYDAFTSQVLHPYSTSAEETIASLRHLVDTIDHLAHSTNVHLSAPTLNSKTISQLRQLTAEQHTLHIVSAFPLLFLMN